MTILRVRINDGHPVTVGVPRDGAVTATVSIVTRKESSIASAESELSQEIEIAVGALQSAASGENEFLKWINQSLKIGDEIRIQIASSDLCDPPTTVVRDDPVKDLERKKRSLEALKRELES